MIGKNVDIIAIALLFAVIGVVAQARRMSVIEVNPTKQIALTAGFGTHVVRIPACPMTHRLTPACTRRQITQIRFSD
jgi:hypothetical protein